MKKCGGKMGRNRKFSIAEMFNSTEKLLLKIGYEGFTMGTLAEELDVSRAALYKYYMNKDELITDFMVQNMKDFIERLQGINSTDNFDRQFDQLMEIIFDNKELHQVLGYAQMINNLGSPRIQENLRVLEIYHKEMYKPLLALIEQGNVEGKLNDQIPPSLLLGFIFQSISIPNHLQMGEKDFLHVVKQMVCNGISK